MSRPIHLFAISAWLLAAAPAMSQTSVDFRQAVKATAPAIVSINFGDKPASTPSWQAVQQFHRDLPNYPSRYMATWTPASAADHSRAGFAVAPDLVVTAQIPGDAEELQLISRDGHAMTGKVVVRDHLTRLAAIRVEGQSLQALAISDRTPAAGEPVIVSWLNGQATVTSYAAMIATESNSDETQLGFSQKLDIRLTEDKSGAPIIDGAGKLVGVALGTAGNTICLPTSHLSRLIQAAAAQQPSDLHRGRIGIQINDGPNDGDGALILNLVDELPAEKAGLKVGDQVLKIGDRDCQTHRDVIAAVAMFRAGDEVTMEIRRDDKTIKQSVTLAQQPSEPRMTQSKAIANPALDRMFRLQDGKLVPLSRDQAITAYELNGSEPKTLLFGLQVERSELEESMKKLEAENARLKQMLESIKQTLDVEDAEN